MDKLDNYVDAFELLGGWDERYQYLTELGERLPEMPSELRIENNKVKGCMSSVWVHAYLDHEKNNHVFFYADCDTSTIKGVLALLVDLMSDMTVEHALTLNLDTIFERLRLYDHLSPNRHFGIYAIVELMKQQVRALEPAMPV